MDDPHPDKISLVIGAYRDDNGKPYVFNVIKKEEETMLQDLNKGALNKEYLQMEGDLDFRNGCKKLVFGEDCKILDRVLNHCNYKIDCYSSSIIRNWSIKTWSCILILCTT